MAETWDNLPPLTGQTSPELADDEHGPFAAGDVVGEYEVVDEVGRGGMCIVYEARDRSLKRKVALKVLRPSLARRPSIARRFYHESVLAASLTHPGIVPVFGRGHQEPAPPYFAMEYVEGRTIEQVVGEDGPLEVRQAVQVAIDVAKTLAYAHARGLVHRDITPRNVLIQDDPRRVRVVDFGIARDTEGSIHTTYQTQDSSLGTLAFMSPEQNLGRDVDNRGDLFSLGMTLYFMLTGTTAYTARNRAELALAFQMHAAVPAGQRNPDVGAALEEVIGRLIAVEPDARPTSAIETADLLKQAWHADREARPQPSKSSNTARPQRRAGRWIATVVGGAVLVIGLYAAIIGWQDEPGIASPTDRDPGVDRNTVRAGEVPGPAGNPRPQDPFEAVPPTPPLKAPRTPTDFVRYAASVVDGIEVPVPPQDWLEKHAPPPTETADANAAGDVYRDHFRGDDGSGVRIIRRGNQASRE